MLADAVLRPLKPTGKIYKFTDRQGLYAAVTAAGKISFRFDYKLHGRRETLVVGRYDSNIRIRQTRDLEALDYRMRLSLAEARLLLDRARKALEQGQISSRTKVRKRVEAAEALTFGSWATKYFEEMSLADSTQAMMRSVYARNLEAKFGRLKLEEITPARQMARCDQIKERGALNLLPENGRQEARC